MTESRSTSGGDPNVAYSPCQTELPPIIGGTPTPPPTPNYGPGSYRPLPAARILDTRSGPGPIGKVGPDGMLTVDVTGVGGVPASAVSAVVLNVTVTEPTSVSFLTVFPSPSALPLTSIEQKNLHSKDAWMRRWRLSHRRAQAVDPRAKPRPARRLNLTASRRRSEGGRPPHRRAGAGVGSERR